MYPITLCSFWRNFSGHFARLACNHSYGYAFRPIEQIDSLTDFIKYTPLSAFSCNMRASPHIARFIRSEYEGPGIAVPLSPLSLRERVGEGI